MSEFRMPSLGADMEAGTLVEWMRRPGERVQRGDALAAVETQKGAIEIEAFENGVLDDLRVRIGERVPVGTVLAYIRTDAEIAHGVASAPADRAPEPAPAPAAVPTAPVPAVAAAAPPARAAPAAAVGPRPRITPAAWQRARQRGLDPATIAPGADGVIGLREVEAAPAASAPSPTPTPAPTPARPAKPGLDLDEMRRAIAAAMARSWREIPHYFVSSQLDLTPLLAWLERENAQRPVPARLHYAAPLIKATALALKAVPALNGQYGERGFAPAAQVHLGVAVALRGGGLVAPALLDADTLELAELMRRLDDLVARVRGGRLRSSEMSAVTATLSILGEDTADTLQPVIYPPQVAIVGCGRLVERPWAHDGALSVRRTMTITVGGDHRVSDGRTAAKFLNHLDALLRAPERL
jgi:pyruvate dehydrogenase E2 component (dihydrolipoamide acetyltransferase)